LKRNGKRYSRKRSPKKGFAQPENGKDGGDEKGQRAPSKGRNPDTVKGKNKKFQGKHKKKEATNWGPARFSQLGGDEGKKQGQLGAKEEEERLFRNEPKFPEGPNDPEIARGTLRKKPETLKITDAKESLRLKQGKRKRP